MWLGAHPNRSQEWLQERLRDGFDIHHVDGNHMNDDPANLVLIEHDDHMRLHGCPTFSRLSKRAHRPPRRKRRTTIPKETMKRARARREVAYLLCTSATPWEDITEDQKLDAQKHAEASNLPWPPV